MCAGGFRGPKSSNRIELSWFVQELLWFFQFWFTWPWGVGQVGGGCLGWSTIVYVSSGMFRGKESSNRIELSWLVQELSNFGVFGFLRRLGVGVGGGWGVPHTHACTHAHARTCLCGKHGNFMQMATPIGFGEIPGIPYDVMCAWVHAHACAHGWGAPSHHHPPPWGDPQNHSKFNGTWTHRDISILFEDLKSVESPPPMGGCIICGWVGSGQITKNLKIADWIKIIQLCLKIYDW